MNSRSPEDRFNRTVRTVTLVLLAVVLVSVTASYARRVSLGRSAILRWEPQMRALFDGENIYAAEHPFPNPPLMPICLSPLLGAVIWSLRIAGGRQSVWPWVGIGAVLLMSARTFMSDLQHGNINLLIVFLVIAALWQYTRNRVAPAGLLLALATTFKVTPALFLPYFVYKREWRLVAWLLGGLVAFLLVVPGLVFGFGHNWDLLTAWFEAMVLPYARDGVVELAIQINQSIPGLFTRLFTETPGVRLRDGTDYFVNLMNLDPGTTRLAIKGIHVALVALLALVCRAPTTDRGDWRLACEFALVLIAMLWISERSWKHHYVTMVLPYACIVAAFAVRPVTREMRRVLVGALVGAFLLMLSTSREVTGWVAHGEGHKWFLAYGAFFWSSVVIFSAIVMLLVRARTVGGQDDPAPN
jgi:hypothetical protein